jgi:hypothetical protein
VRLVGLAFALAAGALLYRLLVWGRLEQTSALFIGVPTLLTIWVALLPPAKTGMGTAMRATTLALLMSGILLGEGFLCILFSAPLFYLIAYVVAYVVEGYRGRRSTDSSPGGSRLRALVLLPLLASSLEGVTPTLSLNRREAVIAERVVLAEPAAVAAALAQPLRVAVPLPGALRIGFPRPDAAAGGGLVPGDERSVHFTEGEGRPPGTLRIVVVESSDRHAVFTVVEDTSHVTHWLRWREATVRWERAAPGRTRVVWTLVYERALDPAWYWRPFMRFFASAAAAHLIDAAATPERDA